MRLSIVRFAKGRFLRQMRPSPAGSRYAPPPGNLPPRGAVRYARSSARSRSASANSRAGSCAAPAPRPRRASGRARSPSRSRDSSKVRNAGTASRRGSPSCGHTAPRRPARFSAPATGLPAFSAIISTTRSPKPLPQQRKERARQIGRLPICGPRSIGRSDRTRPSARSVISAPRSAWNVSPAALASRRSRRSTLRLRDDSAPRKSSKLAVAFVLPMELHADAAAASRPRPAPSHSSSRAERHVHRRQAQRLGRPVPTRSAMAATGTPAPGRRSSRGPGTGLNGTATCSFG